MTMFAERLEPAREHERAVKQRIEAEGWTCELFGQGQMTELMRGKLKGTSSPVRWLADMLAVRSTEWCLVEAKSGRSDTPNYAIEESSLDAHLAFSEALETRVVIVWPDFQCNYADQIKDAPAGPYNGRGSGTPFLLVPKSWSIPFVDVFGQKQKPADDDDWWAHV